MNRRAVLAGDIAVAAAIEQTADAAERQAQRRTRGDYVGHFPIRHLAYANPEEIRDVIAQESTYKTAVKHHAAVPEPKELKDGAVVIVVLNHERRARADDP